MNYFLHPQALCESTSIGENTRIWAFTHILPGATIGRECNICDHVFIENNVIVGNQVTIKCGVQLWDGIIIHDNVFIGPNVTFTNDIFPRSKIYPEQFLSTEIHKGASIGANATILPGISIGQNAMVGAGSVVIKSVPPNAIVVGNPAKIISYADSVNLKADIKSEDPFEKGSKPTTIEGVNLYRFPLFKDLRGNLSVGEFTKTVPFLPKRYFLVFDVASAEIRGEHAHKECHQFLICVKGGCSVVVDNGKTREEIRLDSATLGLHLPPMIWACQYKYTADAVLLVFASEHYDSDDYIRDYQQFLSMTTASEKN